MRVPVWLWLILALYLGFASAYASITPYRQPGQLRLQRGADGQGAQVTDIGAPDERQHANYVARFMRGEGVPTFDPKDPNLGENYQFHQPPLYYLIATGFSKVVGAEPTAPSGIRLRWLNVLLGTGTLVCIFLAGRWGLGSDSVGLGGAALAGLTPMFLALHAAVSNDPLLILWGSLTLVTVAHAFRFGWTSRTSICLALFAGLALWTKTSAVALLPTLFAATFVCRSSGSWITRLAPVAGAVMLIAPWWVRNTKLYGDPLAMTAFREAFVGSAQRADLVTMIGQIRQANGLDAGGAGFEYWTQWFGWWTLRSFFGAFSQMDIFFSDTVYRMLAAVALVMVIAWVLTLKRQNEEAPEDHQKRTSFSLVLGVLLGVVALMFVQFNLTYFQAQARYLYPAAIAIFLGLGAVFRTVPAARFAAVLLTCQGLLILGNIAALGYIQDQFILRTR